MMMLKTIHVVILALVLVGGASAFQKQAPAQPNGGASPSGAAPALVIDSFTHDFGEVKAGTPLRYAFIVKNSGTADLSIIDVSPG